MDGVVVFFNFFFHSFYAMTTCSFFIKSVAVTVRCFLLKSIPSTIKETHPEIVQVWKICQRLWLEKCAGVYEEIRGFDWNAEAV